jgi:hypothetical protein
MKETPIRPEPVVSREAASKRLAQQQQQQQQ